MTVFIVLVGPWGTFGNFSKAGELVLYKLNFHQAVPGHRLCLLQKRPVQRDATGA